MTGLVYHMGALGDFVTTLPAIAVWRRLRSFERVRLLGRPDHARLVPELIDEVWDAGAGRFASLLAGDPGPAALAGLVASEALVFATEGSGIVAGLRRIGIPRILRQDPFPASKIHVVDWHLSLFPQKALDEGDRIPRVGCVTGVDARRRGVAIHPGTGSKRKNWPLGRFLALAGVLGKTHEVAWIIGPVEEESGIVDHLERERAGDTRWRGVALPELVRRLSDAALLVCGDCGVAHLAAAAGCPLVVLFGDSDPAVWAPRGRAVSIVGDGTGGMSSIAVEQVTSACRAMLSILPTPG